jgi:crotonobetainyl-CoA:carnitine CoA-transferase CaiB-like acyl-CoA transferase
MGPLAGVKVVEFAGIGPGPICCMLLADLGATVLSIDRTEPSGLGISRPPQFDLTRRGRKKILLDLKSPADVARGLQLIARADALVEGFRPGVMERLGLGPDICLARNPRLIYGRMTGWGQDGPLAKAAGHDLNYVAVAGALNSFGREGQLPAPPLNIAGDFGGALYLALGIVSGILDARSSGKGQVVDSAMVETAAHMMTAFHGLRAAGLWNLERGTNLIDSGAFFYDCFECQDGKLVSVAPIEPKFFAQLLQILDVDPADFPAQSDRTSELARSMLAEKFRSRTRDEWMIVFEGSDACVFPVLSLDEARHHPHLRARNTFVDIAGVVQPAPMPRFSRTVPDLPSPPDSGNASVDDALSGWLSEDEITDWKS